LCDEPPNLKRENERETKESYEDKQQEKQIQETYNIAAKFTT
jgi:hypothetical protein